VSFKLSFRSDAPPHLPLNDFRVAQNAYPPETPLFSLWAGASLEEAKRVPGTAGCALGLMKEMFHLKAGTFLCLSEMFLCFAV